jgi:cell division protein FtsI/penicillin-binding protein 2
MNNERTFRFRSRLMRLILIVAMLTLVLRLSYIQVVHANSYGAMSDKWIIADKNVYGTRGAILDRNGQKLAFTGVAYDINVDLDRFYAKDKKPDDTLESYAQFLSPLLGMSQDDLIKYMTPKDDKGVVRTKGGVGLGPKGQKVDASIADKLDEMHKQKRFLGITASRTDIRRYPYGDFASHVLGYVAPDDKTDGNAKGMAGVETEYDKQLTGTKGHEEYYTDQAGNPVPTYQPKIQVPPVPGENVVLTIDQTIQHYVEDEMNNIVDQYAPKHASVIVADPNNGEILAMANRPSYDPGKFAEADPEALWNDWALRAFEPGSTFKSYVLTGALAEHKLNLDDTFQSGSISVDGRTINDWNNGVGWGTIDYRYAVQVSSNVGFVHVGQKLGKDLLYDYLYKFGFNQKTGIDLPGEENSVLFDPKKMRDIDLASTSFGQGVSVTPMQQLAGMMAIANGGKVYQPHVVKEFRDQATDKVVQEVQPKVTHTVADPETMATVRQVLEDAIRNDKNAGSAFIPGYHVAGKTGTAQIPNQNNTGYDDAEYRCSFMGFAPADKPRVMIYVTVDSPTKNNDVQFGSVQAEPSGRVMLNEILHYMQVPFDPNGSRDGKPIDPKASASATTTTTAEPMSYVKVPDFIGLTKDQANALATGSSLTVDSVGASNGPKVTGQWPDTTYGPVPKGSEVKLYYGTDGAQGGKVKMPDLSGLSLREAMETLALLKLKIDPLGSGYVKSQAVPAGSMVAYGTSVKLQLAPQS